MLDLIDDESARIESFAAMRGTDPDPDRHVGQLQRAHPMDAQRMLDRKSPHGFGDDAIAFLHRQFLESLVFEPRDCLTLVQIPHPAFETDIAARARGLHRASRALGIDGGFSETKMHQPPATGGMKNTAWRV